MSKVRESQASPEDFHMAKNAILNAITHAPKEPAVGGSGFMNLLHGMTQLDDIDAQLELEYRRQLYRQAADVIQLLSAELQRGKEHRLFSGRPMRIMLTIGALTIAALLGYTLMPPDVTALHHQADQQPPISESWKPPNANLDDWNDNLDDVFRDIEQSLQTLTNDK